MGQSKKPEEGALNMIEYKLKFLIWSFFMNKNN